MVASTEAGKLQDSKCCQPSPKCPPYIKLGIQPQLKGVAMLWECMLGAIDNTLKPVLSKALGHKFQFILNRFC